MKNTIKGILAFFLGVFIIIIFFRILSALFSGEKDRKRKPLNTNHYFS
jgi:hypothetical protein